MGRAPRECELVLMRSVRLWALLGELVRSASLRKIDSDSSIDDGGVAARINSRHDGLIGDLIYGISSAIHFASRLIKLVSFGVTFKAMNT
jgi:hypothetical protein